MFRAVSPLPLVLLLACGAADTEADKAKEPEVPERCRTVHIDKLAENDWVGVKGSAADPKLRMRVTEKGGGYEAWYVGGFFTKMTLAGEKREKDVQFTEVPTPERKALIDKGELDLTRIYVIPRMEKCAIEVLAGTVDGKGKEKMPPKGPEMVAFPEKEGVAFTYRPPARTLFLGKAAKNRAVAEKQIAENGTPESQHEYGDIPVGVFTKAEEDGPADCTYDMDLYFDDKNDPELAGLPAGDVNGGWRHWFHEWKAPFSGNHHFEMYRYRTCGGERELIDVAALEAVLL